MTIVDELSNCHQFILYRLVPREGGKTDKVPTDPLTGDNSNAQDPATWLLPHEALAYAALWGEGYGIGLVLAEGSGRFCIDLDYCRDGEGWQPHTRAMLDRFPGAYVEVSVSGQGLHILGSYTGPAPEHRTRNKTYRMEGYTRERFIAITGHGAYGSITADQTAQLHGFLADYFPPREDVEHGVEWTTTPVPQWSGPEHDGTLLDKAVRSHSAKASFGGGAAFRDVWSANPEILARVFPPQSAHQTWDGSAADLALANHLAFWTGNNCERMQRLMWTSGLVRPKWDREDYMRGTILRACASQTEWYNDGLGAGPGATADVPATPVNDASATALGPPAVPPPPAGMPQGPSFEPGQKPKPGDYITIDAQRQIFAGMCYVHDIHRIQEPSGRTSKRDTFDSWFGGALWAMTPDGQKPSKSAWDAFTLNEIYTFPRADTQCFDPSIPTGLIRQRDGRTEVNSYRAPVIRRVEGDPAPFLDLIRRMLPTADDAEILLSYMAAAVQNPGVKFKWAPFLQGVKGNGKSTIADVFQYCIGIAYTHQAKASELGEKFNSVLVQQLLVIVDEMHSDDVRQLQELLKLYITSDRIEVRPMYGEKTMKQIIFNMLLISNHKNGVRIDDNERRFAPLFCAQQAKADLKRDGLTTDYFLALREWLNADGFAICADYLQHRPIADEYNPAKRSIRAPETSSSKDASKSSLGPVEQEVLEAITQQVDGFRNGWVSATALDHLLARIGKAKAVPRHLRGEILQSLGYVPHPSLPDGLCSVAMTDGTFARLFILKAHPWAVDHLTAQQVRDGFLEHQKR